MQLVLNSCVTASGILLLATGFLLVYKTSNVIDFSQAALYSLSAYVTLSLLEFSEVPVWIAMTAGVVGAGGVALLVDVCVLSQLRKRGANALVVLLAALGVTIVLQNCMAIVWGDDVRVVRIGIAQQGIEVLGATIAPIRAIILAVALVTTGLVHLWLTHTRVGMLIRATGSSADLAEITGVRTGVIHSVAAVTAALVVGLGGVLLAVDVGVTPTIGTQLFVTGAVAVLFSGRGTALSVAVAAMILAVAQECTVWVWGSAWRDIVPLLALAAILVRRGRQTAIPLGLTNRA